MKKIVLTFFSISLCSLFASAQITKGSFLLGGGISFGESKTKMMRTNTNTAVLELVPALALQ
jgi:hypothetical protein